MINIKKKVIETLCSQETLMKYEIDLFIRKKIIENVKNYYSIITAVYNTEKYLDNYFKSITTQSLDFEKYIHIILIDDGSTDDSANIIKKWKEKFNLNISYIRCENGGQATARNLAIKYIKTPWITFIDADDTINNIYFEEVNSFLNDNSEIDMISCNQIFYIQETQKEKKHYLSYRFKDEVTVVNPTNMQRFIQSTASSVFFKTKLLSKHNLYFKPEIKPVFEDGFFVNSLLIKEPTINIAFLQKPIYYYTKREDNSSTVDTAWQKQTRYDDALKFALLELLKTDNNLYIQRFALYQTYWYFKKIINNPKTVEFLTKEQIENFKKLLQQIFLYIEIDTIESCALGGMWHKYRIGFYHIYKKNELIKQVCYLDSYDYELEELKLHYYFHSNDKEIFLVNNKKLKTNKYEIIEHKFINEMFVYEKIIYLPIKGKWEYLDIKLCDVPTQISLNKKRYKNGIQLSKFI
ncbi:MAG: glycosyltransferase family 2 protein [Campylobacterota bacterium]|nr:glycosyltransferase family 2 protein [Campylobacterota bacterium]